MSQMTDVQLQTKENLARNFLEIARKILPGISRLKVGLRTRPKSGWHFFVQGTALYELYLSIQQRALRAFHDPGTWGGLGSGDVLSMLTMAGEHLQVPMKSSNCAYQFCNDPWEFLDQILLEVRYFPLGMYWLSELRASTPGRGETLWTSQVWKTFWLIKKFKTYWLINNLKLSGW